MRVEQQEVSAIVALGRPREDSCPHQRVVRDLDDANVARPKASASSIMSCITCCCGSAGHLCRRIVEEIRKHFATLQANVAGDLHDFETSLKAQAAAVDSARTAMAQTDDLVERVVEALELMQTSMIEQHETAGVN